MKNVKTNEVIKSVEVAEVAEVAKTIKELSEIFNVSTGVIRTAIAKPVIGEVYVEGSVNIKELRNYLIKKANGKANADQKLGFDIDLLEIKLGARKSQFERVTVDELEVGAEYTLRNYHFETAAKFVGKTTVGNVELWIFLTEKEYKALDKSRINNEHFSIIKA